MRVCSSTASPWIDNLYTVATIGQRKVLASNRVPKVLVSNNGELLRHFTTAPFKRLGIELVVAQNGEDARQLFEREEPALVVLDVEQGGFETAKAIKAKSPATRLILVAGKLLTGDQTRALEPAVPGAVDQ